MPSPADTRTATRADPRAAAAPHIPSHLLLFPAPMPLFPTAGSLKEVLELAESKLPITDKNELHSLFMTYHNTLLALI